jgi:hypothetical protein
MRGGERLVEGWKNERKGGVVAKQERRKEGGVG